MKTIQTTFWREPEEAEKFQKFKEEEDKRISELYSLYPRHTAPAAAAQKIRKALRKTNFDILRGAVIEYAAAVSRWTAFERKNFIPLPATWFNQERYLDDRSTWESKGYGRDDAKAGVKKGEYEYKHRVKLL